MGRFSLPKTLLQEIPSHLAHAAEKPATPSGSLKDAPKETVASVDDPGEARDDSANEVDISVPFDRAIDREPVAESLSVSEGGAGTVEVVMDLVRQPPSSEKPSREDDIVVSTSHDLERTKSLRQLRDMCIEKGLSDKGKKSDLAQRLMQ